MPPTCWICWVFWVILGSGLLYLIGHGLGLGQTPVQVVTADYGAKFVVVAGLLNLISAVDAHSIAVGRKP